MKIPTVTKLVEAPTVCHELVEAPTVCHELVEAPTLVSR
jgi:hypothetical protein